jgi:hypothetical protein
MNRQRNRRSPGAVYRARRIRPRRDTSSLTRPDRRRPANASSDGAVLALLAEVLIGDSAWSMAEVQRLISMREVAELGRWRVAGLDDEEANAG